MKVNRIIPPAIEPGPEVFDQLRAEYRQHLARAQELYEKALQAHMSGASNRDLLFRQAILEQNAALLSQGEINRAGIALLIGIIRDLVLEGDDEVELPPAAGGEVQ